MLIKLLKEDFRFENEAGSLVQLIHTDWRQVNVIKSKAGSERGGHYHKDNRELFYVVQGRVLLKISKGSVHEEYEFRENDMFMISPYQYHEFVFMSDTILVSMYDIGVEKRDGSKDIYERNEAKECM